MLNNEIINILNFYKLATQLKYKIRRGWERCHVSKERLESIAEHIYGCCILAIAINSEFELYVDLNIVLRMLVVHELEEVIIGDITPFDGITEEKKRKMGKDAVLKILDGLVEKDFYFKLIQEFENRESREAEFAYLIDKLECIIQAKYYDDDGATKVFDLFYNFDRKKFLKDEIFLSIVDFLKDYDFK